jgi:hypothetical protein
MSLYIVTAQGRTQLHAPSLYHRMMLLNLQIGRFMGQALYQEKIHG